jgi:hypothetical protein
MTQEQIDDFKRLKDTTVALKQAQVAVAKAAREVLVLSRKVTVQQCDHKRPDGSYTLRQGRSNRRFVCSICSTPTN